MVGERLSHFRILEKIGEGGMGVVYRAEDERLGREVALKVLPPEAVGSEERRLRFLREARAAAAVTHPHIAAVHEVGEDNGVVYIAMELVQGETLASQIEGRRLTPRSVLSLSIEIAEALSRAHEAGVVHRDLKPGNVIVGRDGHAKILDFGLARLHEEESERTDEMSRVETISAELTRKGRIYGTVAYMSPEQARGRPVDARSDLFSFGVVLYEMATGTRPFRGDSSTDTLSAILRDRPAPPSTVNPEVGPELERIVAKCLEKEPGERYQHADELVVDLRRLRRESRSQTVSGPTASGPATIAPARRPWLLPAGLMAVLLIVVAGAVWGPRFLRSARGGSGPPGKPASLAVLPVENLKDASDRERVGQILQELIITDLSGVSDLRVFSSQRLFDIQKQLGGADRRTIDRELATEVARRAGAQAMLTGSLSELGERWILTTQLVSLDDGSVLQSERVDGNDLYAMAGGLTARIRSRLSLAGDTTGKGRGAPDLRERTTSSLEAYRHYLAGVEHLNASEWDEAVAELNKAIELDPEFGQAHYKLAIASWWADDDLPWYEQGSEQGPAAILENLLAGEVRLSGRERRLAEAAVHLLRREYEEALPLYESLVKEYPDEKEAWYGLGEARFHAPGGSRDLAVVEAFDRALELDPAFRLGQNHVGQVYVNNRMYEEAVGAARRFIDEAPGKAPLSAYRDWTVALVYLGDPARIETGVEEALGALGDPADKKGLLMMVGWTYQALAQLDKAEAAFLRALEMEGDEDRGGLLNGLGWVRLMAGRPEEALRDFDEALDIDHPHGAILNGLAAAYDDTRHYDEGIERVRALIEDRPDSLPFRILLVRLAIRKGDEAAMARAMEEAEKRCTTDRQRTELWGRAGEDLALSLGDLSRAEGYLEKAMAAAPGEVEFMGWTYLGWTRLFLQDLDGAEEAFLKAQTLSPDTEAVLNGLGQLYLARGDHQRAVEYGRRRLELAAEGPYNFWPLGEALIESGRLDEARDLVERMLGAARSDFGRNVVLHAAALAYLSNGHLDEAERCAGRTTGLGPRAGAWDIGNVHSWISLLRGREEEAEAHVRSRLEVTPRRLGLLLQLASIRVVRGDAGGAVRLLHEVLEEGPASRSVHGALAGALAEAGRFDEALEHAERAVAMAPVRPDLENLAWILVAGDLDVVRGIETAERALAIPERPGEIHMRLPYQHPAGHALGLARLKQGRAAEAVALLEEAAARYPRDARIREDLRRAREEEAARR